MFPPLVCGATASVNTHVRWHLFVRSNNSPAFCRIVYLPTNTILPPLSPSSSPIAVQNASRYCFYDKTIKMWNTKRTSAVKLGLKDGKKYSSAWDHIPLVLEFRTNSHHLSMKADIQEILKKSKWFDATTLKTNDQQDDKVLKHQG